MDDLSARITSLGKTVADVSDRSADPATIDQARRRWLSSASPIRRSSRRGLSIAVVAAACLAILAVVAWPRGSSAISFQVGAPPIRGTVGDWVAAADGGDAVPMRFSEGSLVTLSPGARVRVLETTARGAGLLLEKGALHAAITHRGGDTSWAVRAGPFEVHVTGTMFDVGWDTATETFDLVMRDGSVVVSGPLLPPGRVVVAGEHLVVAVREGRMQLAVPSAEPSATPSCAPDPAESAECAAPTSAPLASATSSAAAPASAEPSWRELAARGKYKDALEAAERQGFEQELERASSGDLLALSDTARFAGRPGRARDALLAMRRRFGAHGRSAFLLGKIAADQQGSSGDAITWFETYLAEEPGGALAEQALGRILELKKARDPQGARQIAERYLARYPNGAYAALARSIVTP